MLKVCAWLRNSPYKAARSIDWSTHTYGDSAHCGAARHAGASGGSECCPPNHQRATMSAESTKEATAEGHKVTSVETPSVPKQEMLERIEGIAGRRRPATAKDHRRGWCS